METSFTLHVDQNACIRCQRCIRVCPSNIFRLSENRAVSVHRIENCILCGHCAAVCPQAAVIHSVFPPEKIHRIDREALPTPQQVMLLTCARRSHRAFTAQSVPDEFLEAILEAAHRAPTASNRQEVDFTLITDPNLLQAVSRLTVEGFAAIVRLVGNPLLRPLIKRFHPDALASLPKFRRLVERFSRGDDRILRGAKALILFHTPAENRFGCQDANLAYQNASLMAESLGVAHFYTGFVCAAAGRDKKKRLARLLDIRGTIHAGMALGMPAFPYPNYMDKKDIRVSRFR